MKKKSKKLTALICALLLLVTIGTGGYTYAKYKTTVTGGGTADIAKWSFDVGNNSQEIQNIKLLNTVESDSLINGKIAPGTSGKFVINIDGTGSEVGIDYDIKFRNENDKPQNMVFTYNGVEYPSLIALENVIKGTIPVNDENKTRTFEILWKWAYETGTESQISYNDSLDTQAGIANYDYTFDVIVTGTQSRI